MPHRDSTWGLCSAPADHDNLKLDVNDLAIGKLNTNGDLLVVLLFDHYSADEGVFLNGKPFHKVSISGYDTFHLGMTRDSVSNAKRRASTCSCPRFLK